MIINLVQEDLILEFNRDINNLNMLVLPGGGIKGYMPSLTMQNICREFNIKEDLFINDYDVVGGTSIGGILALALVEGVTPTKLVKLFEDERKNIFPGHWLPEWAVFLQFATSGNAIYSRDGLKKAILKVLPNADKIKIKDLSKKVILTTLRTKQEGNKTINTPLYITNINSIADSEITREFTILDACCMTSAAPVYFEPYEKDGYKYIDGGVWRNNPVTAVINAMRNEFVYSRRQCVLTIGCGAQDFSMEQTQDNLKKISQTDNRFKNLKVLDGLSIIMNVLNSAISASAEASHFDTLLYQDYNCLDNKCFYYRFQPSLTDAKDTCIDNTTDEFFKYMREKVSDTFKKEYQNIKNFYERIGLHNE